MNAMQFRVLGPVEVVGESSLDLGGPKQRTLLAHLIAQAGDVVPADTLINRTWAEDPPASASNTLQSYVSRLRKILGSDRIGSRSGGYVLHAATDEVDALRFEALVARGRSLVANRPSDAAVLLQEALALWRGRPYADVAEVWELGLEVTRLEELRLVAVEDRIEADLALNRHGAVIGELEALVEEHPWRERMWGQLMTALYRAGRQADALRAFQRARRLLGEELGIEPSPGLRAIEDHILEQSPDLGVPAAVTAPSPDVGMSVRGYELRAKLTRGRYGDVFRAYHASVGRPVDIEWIDASLANDPDFIREFELTARVLGGLAHPAIVPVYDYWREPNAAYFVTRATDDQTLAELVRERELSAPEAIKILDQIAPALDAVHRRGITHGRLDGSAIVVDAEGDARVLGFGPTPSRRSHDEGVAADLEAFAQLGVRLLPDTAPPLETAHTARELAAAYRAAVGLNSDAEPDRGDGHNPYKGLRAFEEADSRDFFGRGALTARLTARMGESGPRSRFLAVVGPSGSGKSSVVKAGLIPALRRGAISGSDRWFTIQMFPGAHPFAALEVALLRIAVNPPATLIDQLEDGPTGILRGINRVLPDATSDVLIVIDQFEELFTLADDDTRDRFLDGLLAALEDPRSRLRLVITLRADFYDRPLAHHGLAQWIGDRNEVVIPLAKGEVEEVVSGPARGVGGDVEPELIVRMVDDVIGQPGALPLLQYSLTNLFEGRTGNRMTLSQYEATGGVAGAVAARAENIYASLTTPERRMAPQVFLRLVTVGEAGETTRRRVRSSELMGLGEDPRVVAAVVNSYALARLLTLSRDPVSCGPTVEVAHEALLAGWPRLSGWVEAATEDVRMFARLAGATQEWLDADRSDDYLLTGDRLEDTAAWAAKTEMGLSVLERDFVATSTARRDEAKRMEDERQEQTAALERRSVRRLRGLVTVTLVAAVVGGVLAALALVQRSEAVQEARLAEGRTLVAEAYAALPRDPELAALLALEAADVDPALHRDSAALLHLALPAHRTVLALPGQVAAAAPDDTWIATGDATGEVRTFDAGTGEPIAEVGRHDAEVTALVVSADGALIASGDRSGSVRIWETATGSQAGGWDDAAAGTVYTLRFTPDAKTLAVAVENDSPTLRDRSGTVIARFEAPVRPEVVERGLDLTEDGTTIVTPGAVFEVPSGEVITVPEHFGEWLTHAAVTSDGQVAVGAAGFFLLTWRSDGEEADWTSVDRTITAVDIRDGGEQVAAGAKDGAVFIWEVGERRSATLSGHDSEVTAVQFLDDGERLLTASSDGTTRVWDLREGADRELLTLRVHECCAMRVGLTGDGSRVATVDGESNGTVRVLDTSNGAAVFENNWNSKDGAVALDADGETLVGAGRRQKAWSLPAGEPILLDATFMSAGLVALSPDGTSAAFVGRIEQTAIVRHRAVDVDEPPLDITGEGDISAVAYAPGGLRIAIGDEAGLLIVDPAAPDARTRLKHPDGLVANDVAFSVDGGRVAASWREGGVSIFAVDSGEMLMNHNAPAGAIAVGFNSDGSTLAVFHADQRLQLLDAGTGNLVVTILDHNDEGTDMTVSADGRRLATVAYDGQVRVYVFDEGELFDLARSRMTRSFTAEECRRYDLSDRCFGT